MPLNPGNISACNHQVTGNNRVVALSSLPFFCTLLPCLGTSIILSSACIPPSTLLVVTRLLVAGLNPSPKKSVDEDHPSTSSTLDTLDRNIRKLSETHPKSCANYHNPPFSPDWNIKPLAVPHAVMAAVHAWTSGRMPCLRAVFSSCRAICGCWPSWHAVMAALRITELPSTWVSWRWLGWDGAKVKVNLDGLMNGRQTLDDLMMCRLIDLIWFDSFIVPAARANTSMPAKWSGWFISYSKLGYGSNLSDPWKLYGPVLEMIKCALPLPSFCWILLGAV